MNDLKKLCRFWEKLVKIGRKELKREYKLQSFNEWQEELVNRNEFKMQQQEIDKDLFYPYHDPKNHQYD